jgi:hypothetical protein
MTKQRSPQKQSELLVVDLASSQRKHAQMLDVCLCIVDGMRRENQLDATQ